LTALGEDPERPGLVKTPVRVENSLRWLTRGYEMSVADAVGDAVFEENHSSMILVRDIEMYSLCEHHLLPFFGRAHVAYIPDRRILGLSKLPRIVEVFARRLQVQERLSDQIADAIMDILQPHGVGVLIEATHLCMAMRGVESAELCTVTSAVRASSQRPSLPRGVPPPGAWTSARMSGLAGRLAVCDRRSRGIGLAAAQALARPRAPPSYGWRGVSRTVLGIAFRI
jgi:GTP cyclohydrolase I